MKEMLINVSAGEECRIALLEDGKLEELYMERQSSTSHVGNIYKGKVTNVEASIQAAFIDFGLGRNGFLHISDLMPTYFGRDGGAFQETVGRKLSRRDRPPIQRCLRRGDEIIVQIIKEGIGTKGPTLTTYLSIPGRILVMMPGMGKMGVSKKIEDDEERRRLRTILDGLKPPKDVGFIIRTAGIGRSKAEIERDLKYLTRVWEQLEKKRESSKGSAELYTEGDLITRTVRDTFSAEIDRIVVDSKDVAKQIKDVIKITAPRTKNKVEIYEGAVPLFDQAGIEAEIERMYSRHVPLPSGGSLVIDSTEAVVAIDVNSGKFRDHSDAEMTAFKTDMEAADEIPRQLKLRDLGGVIICDFIDLRFERHRRELEERLHENLKNDRAKTKVLRMSQFGIIEMTRQRMRPSLKRSIYCDCPHCKGAGLVKTPESMALDVMRRLAIALYDQRVVRVEMVVAPDVSYHLQNHKRSMLAELEVASGKRIVIRAEAGMGLDEIKLQLFDARDGSVMIPGLNMEIAEQAGHGRGRDRGGRGRRSRGGGGGGRQDRNQSQGRPAEHDEHDDEADRFDRDEEPSASGHGEEDPSPGLDEESAVGAGLGANERGPAPEAIDDEHPGDDNGDPAESPRSAASGASVPAEPPEDSEDDAPRGRRRRRGGRGRGRGRQSADADAAPSPVADDAADEVPKKKPTHAAESDDTVDADEPMDEDNYVDDPTAGGSELLARDHGAVGEDDRYRGGRHGRGGQRRGGRGGRGGGSGGGSQQNGDQPPRASQGQNRPVQGGQQAHRQGQHAQPGSRNGGGPRPATGGRPAGGTQRGGRRFGRNRGGKQLPPAPRPVGFDEFGEPNFNVREPDPVEIQEHEEPSGNFADGASLPAPVVNGAAAAPAGPPLLDENGEPRRRRRRRGGRRHRRRRENAEARAREGGGVEGAPVTGESDGHDDDEFEGEEIEPGGEAEALPPPSASQRALSSPPEPIVKTGSTDSHYSDEPVEPPPPSRPRTYRDLDEIPDDLD